MGKVEIIISFIIFLLGFGKILKRALFTTLSGHIYKTLLKQASTGHGSDSSSPKASLGLCSLSLLEFY